MAKEIKVREFIRPWKLSTLATGLALLIVGSYVQPAPDWDVGVSIIMALMTYFTAPTSIRLIVSKYPMAALLGALLAWLSIDGFYWAYWSFFDPTALVMRGANAKASTPLYFFMGMVWLYRGSLADMWANLKQLRGQPLF